MLDFASDKFGKLETRETHLSFKVLSLMCLLLFVSPVQTQTPPEAFLGALSIFYADSTYMPSF